MPATAKIIKFPASHKLRRRHKTAAGFGAEEQIVHNGRTYVVGRRARKS